MRAFCRSLPALLLALLLLVQVRAEETATPLHPERAVVSSPGAAVRSGPGDSYYLTDTLPEETTVEVYRRQPDGWCAIRPPADSFSWVFSQNVRLVDDGLAEISKDDVAARVGSRLSAQRDVVQVRLKAGEKVAILGRDEREGGLWYKIAPPAGEFRWIHAKDIGLGGDVTGNESRPENPVKPASAEEPIAAPPLAAVGATGAKTVSDEWTAAKTPPPATDIRPIGGGAPSSGELADHLRELELRLSRMVAEPPATWNIAPLEQAAEQLLARSDTVADREAVKVTLAKIDRFTSIQRRYGSGTLTVAGAPVALPGAGSGQTAGTATDASGASGAASSPYDAVGILRPVVSRRPGAPQFALVNAQGQVITFVTPAPDVNLQPYVGQRIGVTGSRGYIPEFRRAHVTAGRVSPLNERMLR
jgi:hypothetical protein